MPTAPDDAFTFDPDVLLSYLNEIDRTAIHEAGHVVAGLYFGHFPTRWTMPDDVGEAGFWGQVWHQPTTEAYSRRSGRQPEDPRSLAVCRCDARRSAVILAAGRAAESAFAESPDEVCADAGAAGDRAETAEMLAYWFSADECEGEVQRAAAKAAEIVARPDARTLIRIVADELETLSYDPDEDRDPRDFLEPHAFSGTLFGAGIAEAASELEAALSSLPTAESPL